MSSDVPPTPVPPSAPSSAEGAKPLIPYETFAQLDLRVATVLEARDHPNANKLLLLKVRVGEVDKQIVAGIKGHYAPADLVGRQIVVVNNLQPTLLRGEESQGMLLAASAGDQVVLIRPERELPAGARVK